ncbi:MAG: hypothetical protein ACYCS8_05270 [Acidithiobacillus sp.]
MRGTLINISGKPNSGRTTLALTIAKNATQSGLSLAIFANADSVEILEPLVERLREKGTHVVTVTRGPSVQPVVSITGQPDEFLMRALFGEDLVRFQAFAKNGCGNLGDASPEEAESILSNTSLRTSLHGEDRQSATDKVEHCHAGSHSFRNQGTKLIEAGYVPGMEYRHALEMGKWHPEMERFLADLSGRVGDPAHQEAFNHAKSLAALGLAYKAGKLSGEGKVCLGQCSAGEPPAMATDADGLHSPAFGTTIFGKRPIPMPFVTGLFHKEDALGHSVTWGRTADGMSDPYQAFVQDLHELLVKHADVVN